LRRCAETLPLHRLLIVLISSSFASVGEHRSSGRRGVPPCLSADCSGATALAMVRLRRINLDQGGSIETVSGPCLAVAPQCGILHS